MKIMHMFPLESGVVLAEYGEEPEAPLHMTDIAMYDAKAANLNCAQFF